MTSTALHIVQNSTPSSARPYCAPNPGRILMLSTNLGIGGGAEEQVQQLGLELKARNWTVGIISMLPPNLRGRPNSKPPASISAPST